MRVESNVDQQWCRPGKDEKFHAICTVRLPLAATIKRAIVCKGCITFGSIVNECLPTALVRPPVLTAPCLFGLVYVIFLRKSPGTTGMTVVFWVPYMVDC